MKGINLGEFEELVLLTVGALFEEAYGVSVMAEIKDKTGRGVNISAVHTARKQTLDHAQEVRMQFYNRIPKVALGSS